MADMKLWGWHVYHFTWNADHLQMPNPKDKVKATLEGDASPGIRRIRRDIFSPTVKLIFSYVTLLDEYSWRCPR